MSDAALALEKWTQSADAWIKGARIGDRNRVCLLDDPMIALAGEVAGLQVLDIGSGEGRFCRMLSERGARTTGLDPIVKLVQASREVHTDGVYVQGIAENLPFKDGSFDLAVSYLTMIDIADFRAAIFEIARVLRPGGRVIVANLNSFATTRPRAWHVNEKGEKLHVGVENYYDERALLLEWAGVSILNWHRPMEAYMEAYLSAGLILEVFQEPRPSPAAVERFPEMIDEYRVPLFHVMRWRKP